ncbi:MAG: hypothetical protein IJE05_04690 [Clostridia bacterium]|nr:hypothetical protein [Clostridia bacterium]
MNKKIFKIIFILIVILVIIICIKKYKKEENLNTNEAINNIYTEADRNDISYQENVNIQDLKEQTSIIGNDEIYEIQQEYDGRNVLTVKASLKYKVAFAGMIKGSTPEMDELDKILSDNLPKNNGIWIEKTSRNRILEIFNNNENTNSKYTIDKDGYLKIAEKNSQSDSDKKIEKIINGNKQYILNSSSICYIIDNVTGEILDYNFEKMDEYQTYEYFEDDNRIIVFVNENSNNQLTYSDIFNSIIEIF